MESSLVDGTSLNREVKLRKVKKTSSAEERCAINLGRSTTRTVKQLVYKRDISNGGTRTLTVDEEGHISLMGNEPVYELLEEDGDINHNTRYGSVEGSLEYFQDLSSYVDEGNYEELDEFLVAVEDEANLNFE